MRKTVRAYRKSSGRIPGWSEPVDQLRKSLSLHKLFRDCDRLSNGMWLTICCGLEDCVIVKLIMSEEQRKNVKHRNIGKR